YQGKRFVERFDANSYLYLTRAMDYFDLESQYGSLVNALGKTNARFLIASYDSDWLFTTNQSKEIVRALIECGKHVSFIELKSPFGHDSFLIEIEQLQKMITPFLEQAYQACLAERTQKK
ncbi:MAG: homoserine O-acetyltransferase, partial [Planctomycetota bacterium]